MADKIGIEIRIAHYPPYTSKWNPIEHRVFPHITRSLQGVVLTTHELTKELIEKTTTKSGLTVTANILNKIYETGRKVADGFKESMRIVFDEKLKGVYPTYAPSVTSCGCVCIAMVGRWRQ